MNADDALSHMPSGPQPSSVAATAADELVRAAAQIVTAPTYQLEDTVIVRVPVAEWRHLLLCAQRVVAERIEQLREEAGA